MIAIDRENSKGLWAYKLLDEVDIEVIEKGVKAGGGDYNHIYLVKNKLNGELYIFCGKLGTTYKLLS